MPRALWKGKVIAESDTFEVVEGNVYFPRTSLVAAHFVDSAHHTRHAWKGVASYFDIVVDGEVNRAAVWYYPTPSSAAENIRDHVAFWRGVVVER